MADTPLAQFDASAFQKRVSARILETFGEMIPQEAFNKMVDEQIKEFFEKPIPFLLHSEDIMSDAPHAWSRHKIGERVTFKAPFTPFQVMVWNVVQQKGSERLVKYLSSGGGSELDAILDEVFSASEFKDGQRLTAHQLMGWMASQMFNKTVQAALEQTKSMMHMASLNANMPDLTRALDDLRVVENQGPPTPYGRPSNGKTNQGK